MNMKRTAKMGCAAVATVGAALGTTDMLPASAAGAGVTTSGMSNVTESADPAPPLCLKADSATFSLKNTGVVSNAISTSTLNLSAGIFYFGPGGVSTAVSPLCVPPGLVPVSGTLNYGPSEATTCAVSGSYTRVTTDYEINVSGTCGQFIFTGVQLPCFPDGQLPPPFLPPLVDPCTVASEFTGSYVQV